VKKLPLIMFTLLSFASPFLHADIDLEDIGSQDIPPSSAQEDSNTPFQFQILGDYIFNAKVNNCKRLGDLQVATAQADLNAVYYYDPCHEEGLTAGLSYQWNRLHLQHNPYFSQDNINTASIILSAFTKRVCDWKWTAQVSFNFDNLEYWDFNHYMNYDVFLWGRYTYCQNLGLHAGLYVQTGMKVDRVYPIVGVDWKINDSWMINAIFPMNVSVIYTINCEWNIALAGRFFDQIHRVKKDEPVPMAVWHYQASAVELAANYMPYKWLTANVHAGSTVGGTLKITNSHYESHPRARLKLDPAPYVGAQLTATF
jgi:hypothetical protein